ncbi:MAG TPA: phytanoyl-CoA dioxygenase family protein [Gemmatimonadaceae bacterium]|nr:phytanoyl-CoA dioxygenase family protein [Gemmatimonadaceae bacterium]
MLRAHVGRAVIDACREAFWPTLLTYLETYAHAPNRGAHRHFMPMPFEPPCFAPDFFFDNDVLNIVRTVMDDRVVADQWGCDVPVRGSQHQSVHVDYQRPLFAEDPDLALPAYMLVVSFGLTRIAAENGPIEIAPGTHRMRKQEALRAVEAGEIEMQPLLLEVGDVYSIRAPLVCGQQSRRQYDSTRGLGFVHVRATEHDALPDRRQLT